MIFVVIYTTLSRKRVTQKTLKKVQKSVDKVFEAMYNKQARFERGKRLNLEN